AILVPTFPLGTQAFESSFTQNLLPDGWTVQKDTFLDPADGVFTTAIPLSSHLFTASNLTFDQVVPADPGNGVRSPRQRRAPPQPARPPPTSPPAPQRPAARR